ncbi:hypothetical protein RND81_09G181800 [Saponaria officinalis]|uniref:Coiled-coil SMC6 And NSE5 INteracting (CANIN) domain-containing protein n=1 Tax=Saponaria officinalis TaxID=3572 RepID=A0AAW1INP0_SAPOF
MENMAIDFDIDDHPLPISAKKRKNVIGLDDLFNDHKTEQEKKEKKKSKDAKTFKNCDSDDDNEAVETETKLTETFHNFQQTMKEVDGQEIELIEHNEKNMSLSWGLEVFGIQRTPSPSLVTELGSSLLSQNLLNDEVSVLMEHNQQMGEPFLRGLLINGWLSKLFINSGHLEESVAKWTLNWLLYSSEESLVTSACDFWHAILLCDKVDAPMIKIEWFPGFMELKRALESYGFQLYSPSKVSPAVHSSESSDQEPTKSSGTDSKGPPANIRAWIKIASACCQVRSRYLIFSTVEAQELVATVVCLFLERKLLGLTSQLHDCLLSAIHYFEEKEWNSSCEQVTQTIIVRVPRDLNCLRAVESISGVDTRSKQLRSALASQMLRSCFTEISDEKDVLKFMFSKNLKDKGCDLFKIYIYFVLTENWLLFCTEPGHTVKELWNGIIRKYSSQISNTDFRPCAQEIRNKASYILQNTCNE